MTTAHDTSHLSDAAQYASQGVPISVSSAVFLGITVSDWLIVLSVIIAVLNILWFGVRIYDRFFNGNSTKQDSSNNPKRHE